MKHSKTRIGKKVLVLIAAAVLSAVFSLAASADTTTSTASGTGTVAANVPVTGTISPVTISVTVPLSGTFTSDPNSDSVVAPQINITNNTKCTLNVTVSSITSTGSFTDVLPTAESWGNLTLSDSKKYIAFGLKAVSGGWNTGYATATDWAAANIPVTFGSLAPNTTGSLSMVVDNGHAIDATATDSHKIAFSFSLT